MKKPEIIKSTISAEILRGENNPRNSEGDFSLLKNGSVLFAYSKYTGNDDSDDAACDIAGMISTDSGKSFVHLPHLIATAKEHNTKNIMSVSLCRIPDGTLCLFYLTKFGSQSAVYLRRATEDETHFGEAELCVPLKRGIYYVMNNARICVTTEGKILLPLARHKIITEKSGETHAVYFATACVFEGDSHGKNWKQISGVISMPYPGHSQTGLQEPGIELLPDKRLYGYFRTDRMFQYESFSADNGKNWTRPVQSGFTSPDSPMLIRRNPFSGIYYAVWNPVPNYNGRNEPNGKWVNAGRTPFVIAQSENGIDFSEYIILEDEPNRGYCYPALYFLNEKEMLLSYCCGGPDDGMCLTRTRIRKLTVK